jgi:hypothetical protein
LTMKKHDQMCNRFRASWVAATLAVAAAAVACDRGNNGRASSNLLGPDPVATHATFPHADVSTIRPPDDESLDHPNPGQAAARQTQVLISEVDPHVVYRSDGSWSISPDARLSAAAAAFVQESLAGAARTGEEPALEYERGNNSNSPMSQSGSRSLKRYWWGYRIGLKSGDASAFKEAWNRAGAAGAVKLFLMYFGHSGWAVAAAPTLVPAYATAIWYVDRLGGYRGVYLDVPWTIIPTYIHPQ